MASLFSSDSGLGWGAPDTATQKTQSVDQQYRNKYSVKLNKQKLTQNRLDKIIKDGGGVILTLDKNSKKIQAKIDELAAKCHLNTYEQNLDGWQELLDLKLEILTSDSASEDFEQLQKEEQAKIDEQNDKKQAKLDAIADYLERLMDAYNNAADQTAEGKKKVYEQVYQNIKNEIATSSQYVEYVIDEKTFEIVFDNNGQYMIDEAKTNQKRQDEARFLDKAKAIADKSIQAAEDIAKRKAEKALAECIKSVKIPKKEKENNTSRNIEKDLQKAAKKLSKIPDDIIIQFQQIQDKLMKLVMGFGDFIDPNSHDTAADMEKKLDEFLAALQGIMDPTFKPAFNMATSLSLPVPKIVAPVVDLVKMIPNMDKPPSGLTEEQKKLIEKYKKNPKIQIPQDWQMSLNDMKDTLLTVIGMFPLCLIQLIFNMIDAIIAQIKNLGGSVPYPLSLISTAIELMPKLIDLYMMFPQVLYKVLEKKMKNMIAQSMALGASSGSLVNGIISPTPQCPEALKEKIRKMKEDAEKQRKEQEELKRAELLNKISKRLEKEAEEKAKKDEEYRNSPQYQKDRERAKKQAEALAKLQASIPNTLSEKEIMENEKLQDKILKLAGTVTPNVTNDQPKDLMTTPDDELSDDELKQKYAEMYGRTE